MPVRPEIFISAASRDLKSCRTLVRDALLTLGCVPIVQDHFPPGAGEVRAMLRERIAACHAVIHIAGECYGFEPQERAPSDPHRSYTQLEYDIARELKKPLYTFLCAPDFPYDAHEPEPAEQRALQDAHRAALTAGDHLFVPLKDPQELNLRVRELQTRVETLARDLQKTHVWLRRGLAATAASLLLAAGVLYGVKRQGEHTLARSDEHAAQAEQRASKAEQQLAALQNQLQQQTKLISLVSEKLDRNAPSAAGPGKADPAAAAREETARDLGISEEELEKKLAEENTDLHALYTQVEAGSAAAEAKAAEWQNLKRETLTKLGDAENAAGHYRASVEPYQQAFALCDKVHEPLVWCGAAEDFESALWQMGRYAEAEPLARELLELRTKLLGKEHPDTLTSVNNLANVLDDKGDYAGAEALYRRCLEAHERTLGKEHPDTLTSVNGLASVLADKGDYAGAEALYRRCLEAQERTLGKEHPDTLGGVNNLAIVLRAEGDYAGAEALYRRCLEAQERALDKEHPDTLRSVNNLATVLYDKGDYSGAEALYRRCLEARERTLGKEHPNTLTSVNNLASVLYEKGDYSGAEALYRRCLEALERTLGKEHPDTAMMAFNLSLVKHKQDKPREALPLAEEAVAAAKASLPENHPYRLKYEKKLADLRTELAASPPPTATDEKPPGAKTP